MQRERYAVDLKLTVYRTFFDQVSYQGNVIPRICNCIVYLLFLNQKSFQGREHSVADLEL